MAKQPNHARKHILRICPRGFQNETTYVSVSEDEFREADAYLNTLVDDVNDTSRWLDSGTRLVPSAGGRIDFTWPQYRAEFIDPYK